MLHLIPSAWAADGGIPRKIDVCKSFFNFLRRIKCAGEGDVVQSSIVGLFGSVVNFILGIAASVAMGFIVYAGFLLVLAAADPGQVQRARGIIMNAVFGLLVILSAFLITSAVKAIVYGIPFGA